MKNPNTDFAHAILNNVNGAADKFKADPEAVMKHFKLKEDAKAHLRIIHKHWLAGDDAAVKQGLSDFGQTHINPELQGARHYKV